MFPFSKKKKSCFTKNKSSVRFFVDKCKNNNKYSKNKRDVIAYLKRVVLKINDYLLRVSDLLLAVYNRYIAGKPSFVWRKIKELVKLAFVFIKRFVFFVRDFYKKDKKRAIIYFVVLYVCYKFFFGFLGWISHFFNSHKNEMVVAVREVKQERAEKDVNCYGYLESDNNLNYVSEVRGNVKKILVQEKQYVKEGQLIMMLDSKFTENSYISAKSVLESKKFQYEATKKLYEDGLESKGNLKAMQADLENANSNFESAKKAYNGLMILAPFNGYIDNIKHKEGAQINPGTSLFTLERTDAMQVKCDVQNLSTGEVQVGENVKVYIGGLEVARGKISVIGDSVDVYTGSRTILVNRIEAFEDFEENVKPGMSVMLKILAKSQKAVYKISSEALETTDTGAFMVKILNPNDGAITSKNVRIYNEKDGIDYVFGLTDGDYVVERGHEFVEIGEKGINFAKVGVQEQNSFMDKCLKIKNWFKNLGSNFKNMWRKSGEFFDFASKEFVKDCNNIKAKLSKFL